MGVAPSVGAAGPVEREEHEGRAAHIEEGADGVDGPEVVFELHVGVLLVLGRPVEEEEPDSCNSVEPRLHPEDVPPTPVTCVREGATTEVGHTKGVERQR